MPLNEEKLRLIKQYGFIHATESYFRMTEDMNGPNFAISLCYTNYNDAFTISIRAMLEYNAHDAEVFGKSILLASELVRKLNEMKKE